MSSAVKKAWRVMLKSAYSNSVPFVVIVEADEVMIGASGELVFQTRQLVKRAYASGYWISVDESLDGTIAEKALAGLAGANSMGHSGNEIPTTTR